MSGKSFSGEDLEEALTEGTLTQAQTPLTGMVKPSEKSGHVSFSQAGCDTWVDLPTDMIERADHVGKRPCRDHSHPLMRITLNEPEDPEAKTLLSLLAQAATSPSEAQHVDELETDPTPTPETGVSFRSFGQNAPPQPWLNEGGDMFDGGLGLKICTPWIKGDCIRWADYYDHWSRRWRRTCVAREPSHRYCW